MVKVSSWGRLSDADHEVDCFSQRSAVSAELLLRGAGLPIGMRRSYGDECLNPGGRLWDLTGLDHFISFDEQTGVLQCEAGVLLRDVQRFAIPRGWSLPVTPGTQLVSVGGAIANDIHGKNHHRFGSFGDHVIALELVRSDGERIQCGFRDRTEWLDATIGGMGLTGIITQASVQMRRTPGPWLNTETLAYSGLPEFFELADQSEVGWEHTVSWIDCLAGSNVRGLFMRANPASDFVSDEPAARSRSVPFVPPFSFVNRLSLQAFNTAYFQLKKWRAGTSVQHYQPFFYPLDNLQNWNRMYGPRGFYQYQSLVPRASALDASTAMLDEIARSGAGSFLAVLKTFGARSSRGMLGFPQPGVTLALDFPNHGEQTLKLFDRLDAIVAEAHGRLYAAKDARMSRELFEAGYPHHAQFQAYRDPGISSAMSRRLLGW